MPAKKAEPESQQPPEEIVLSEEDFLTQLKNRRKPETFKGCRVQGLSATDYQRFKALRYEAALSAKGKDREEQFKVGECAAWLTLGVIEPKISYDRWLHELKSADGGTIERIVEKIKELSGAGDIEVELAKKVYEQIQGDTMS